MNDTMQYYKCWDRILRKSVHWRALVEGGEVVGLRPIISDAVWFLPKVLDFE